MGIFSFRNRKRQIYFKITEHMFELLVAGKEVIIELADGTELHFILEDMGWTQMQVALHKARSVEKRRD